MFTVQWTTLLPRHFQLCFLAGVDNGRVWNLSGYAQQLHDKTKWLGVADCQHPDTMQGWRMVMGINKDGGMMETSVDIWELPERSVMFSLTNVVL